MTKKFSTHLLAVAFSFLVGISSSGTGHAASSNALSIDSFNPTLEVQELAHMHRGSHAPHGGFGGPRGPHGPHGGFGGPRGPHGPHGGFGGPHGPHGPHGGFGDPHR